MRKVCCCQVALSKLVILGDASLSTKTIVLVQDIKPTHKYSSLLNGFVDQVSESHTEASHSLLSEL